MGLANGGIGVVSGQNGIGVAFRDLLSAGNQGQLEEVWQEQYCFLEDVHKRVSFGNSKVKIKYSLENLTFEKKTLPCLYRD